jgi:hypothetical protein
MLSPASPPGPRINKRNSMESYSYDCVLYPEITKKASRSNHQKPASRSRRRIVRSDCDVRQVPIVDIASPY